MISIRLSRQRSNDHVPKDVADSLRHHDCLVDLRDSLWRVVLLGLGLEGPIIIRCRDQADFNIGCFHDEPNSFVYLVQRFRA
jgi:hypothetical protein